MISNDDVSIKTHAGEIIGDLIKILNEEDRGKYILTMVLNMAHDDHNENNRIVAVQVWLIIWFNLKFGLSYWVQWQIASEKTYVNNL